MIKRRPLTTETLVTASRDSTLTWRLFCQPYCLSPALAVSAIQIRRTGQTPGDRWVPANDVSYWMFIESLESAKHTYCVAHHMPVWIWGEGGWGSLSSQPYEPLPYTDHDMLFSSNLSTWHCWILKDTLFIASVDKQNVHCGLRPKGLTNSVQ